MKVPIPVPTLSDLVSWPRNPRDAPKGNLVHVLESRGIIDDAAAVGARGKKQLDADRALHQLYAARQGLAGLRPDLQAKGADWFWRGFGEFAIAWSIQPKRVRRVWLCVAILGEDGRRPMGYTVKDIGKFARAQRKIARDALTPLTRFGVLRERRDQGYHPRYEYHQVPDPDDYADLFRVESDEFHRRHMRHMDREFRLAISRRPRDRKGRTWETMGFGWIAGETKALPPDSGVAALREAIAAGLSLLGAAMGFQGIGTSRLNPMTERRVLEWIHTGGLDEAAERLVKAVRELDATQWSRWRRTLYEGDSSPVLIANVFDLLEGPFHATPE